MIHIRSGNSLITDAPTDNHGKGEAFSPTDLLAASMISCMVTVMGIAAEKRGWDMGQVKGTVEKHMAANPRRIARLDCHIHFTGNSLTADQRKLLEEVALNCPVAKSIHPDMEYNTEFSYE